MKMLKKAIIALSFAVSAMSVMPAHAAFVATDWIVADDGLATLDTDTGLEWLDLTLTDNKSYSEVTALLSTTLSGWRFPTASEVHAMMSSFFSVVSTYDDATYNVKTNTKQGSGEHANGPLFRALFGHTYSYYQSGNDWSRASYGLFKDDSGNIVMSGEHRRNYWNGSYYSIYHNYDVGVTTDIAKYANGGYFLVSDGGLTLSSVANPELNINNPNSPINQSPQTPEEPVTNVSAPHAMGLFGLCLLALGLSSRRRKATFRAA